MIAAMTSRPAHLRTIEGIHDCGSGFVVSATNLGKAFPTRIGGRRVSVVLPNVSGGDSGIGSFTVTSPTWEVKPQSAGAAWDPDHWGLIVTSQRTEDGQPSIPLTALVRGLLLSAELAASDDPTSAVEEIAGGLKKWWNSLVDWIEVCSDQDMNPLTRPAGSETGASLQMWWMDEDTYRQQAIVMPSAWTAELPRRTDPELTATLLQRCLDAAANGSEPPLEWQLLRDARNLRRHGDYRRAVIDAGTAAELAMTRTIDGELVGTRPEVADALMAKYQTLNGRSQLLKKMGGSVPPSFQQTLSEPRNRAAHQGNPPSYTETVAAITIATEVVQAVLPLPDIVR